MLVGYARVSTDDQNLNLQRDALDQAGCEQIFKDQLSGAKAERPGLHQALQYARTGDTIVVWRLDRLSRSLKDLIEMVTLLESSTPSSSAAERARSSSSLAAKRLRSLASSAAARARSRVRASCARVSLASNAAADDALPNDVNHAPRTRKDTLAAMADGTISLVVGTHALLADTAIFHDLGLAVIDEQHRFGVRQRILLGEKGNINSEQIKGDVKIIIKIMNDSIFQRKGLDLYYVKKLSLKDALCGFSFDIEHISQKKLSFNNVLYLLFNSINRFFSR